MRSLLLALMLPLAALAQTNRAFPVQGVLTDSAGDAVDGTVSVTFALYVNEVGGVALWSETQSVAVDDGLFSVYLGDVASLDPALFATNEGLWLGIAVGTDAEMGRVFLGASPYAGYAEIAGNVPTDLSQLSGSVGVAALPSGVPVGPSFCPPGTVVDGLQSSGALRCVTDSQGSYTGADFALSDQACPADQVFVGIDASGLPLCEVLYAGDSCGIGQVVTGFELDGAPTCTAALDVLAPAGDLTLGGSLSAAEGSFTGAVGADTLAVSDSGSVTGSLTAGSLSVGGDSSVGGDLDVSGTLTVAGESFGYPTGPEVLFGMVPSIGANNGNNMGWVQFPTKFSAEPIFIASIDETLNNNGATWQRTHQLYRGRAGIRLDTIADGLPWMAIEEGVHTVDGKQVVAGSVSNVQNGTAIFFPALFTQPPVVLLQIDLTDDETGGSRERIIGNVTTGGFEVWLDGDIDRLHYVALDPGEYTHGRYHWYAGVWNINNSCTGGTSNCLVNLPSNVFTDPPDLLLTVNDTNNSGASYVRARRLGTDEVRLYLQNNTELVHYLAFEQD